MVDYEVEFVEEIDNETVEAPSRPRAFVIAERRYDATPRRIMEVESDEMGCAIHDAVEEEAEAVEDYLDGEDGAMNYLVGNVMARVGGSEDPGEVRSALVEHIEEDDDSE